MRPHEKLDVWKKAVEMVTLVYEITKQFPSDERFGLTSQIRRAAVSIPSELETELPIAKNLGYLNNDDYDKLYVEINTIARMVLGLSKTVRSRIVS